MTFACLGLFLDIHVIAQRVGVLLAAVGECFLSVFDLFVFDVWVVVVTIDISDVQMVCFLELEGLSIPSTHVEVESTILVPFLAYAGFEQLVGRGSRPVLQVLKHDLFINRTL